MLEKEAYGRYILHDIDKGPQKYIFVFSHICLCNFCVLSLKKNVIPAGAI